MIYVFGGCNIDIIIKMNEKVNLKESNPASIMQSFGGVGRNIARNIGNYKKCEFITCFGTNIPYELIDDLLKHNVSLTYSIYSKTNTSMYIDMIDPDGVVVGASIMDAIDELSFDTIKRVIDKINDDDIVVIDSNFNRSIFEYVVKNSKGLIFMDSVSSKKLLKLKDLLEYVDILKVNEYEYESIKEYKKDGLLITSDIITLIYNNETYKLTHNRTKSVNPTGCGDTFFSSFIANFDKGIKNALIEAIRSSYAVSLSMDSTVDINDINKIDIKDLDIKWL